MAPELRYLADSELVSQFDRYVCFNSTNPREQIGVLAFDEEEAEIDGANELGLCRSRVSVIRAPGFLQSSNVA